MAIDWAKVNHSNVLEDVLARLGVQLRARVGWQPVRCPNGAVHARGDKNPSAQVNVGLGKFLCHGCGLHGDGFDLARDLLGLTAHQILDGLGEGGTMSDNGWLF